MHDRLIKSFDNALFFQYCEVFLIIFELNLFVPSHIKFQIVEDIPFATIFNRFLVMFYFVSND